MRPKPPDEAGPPHSNTARMLVVFLAVLVELRQDLVGDRRARRVLPRNGRVDSVGYEDSRVTGVLMIHKPRFRLGDYYLTVMAGRDPTYTAPKRFGGCRSDERLDSSQST